mmetsp:Transcript_20997/g.37569  ORF Transcript_20997/g.37569 Transcript_20997/m.37569 type:complete len:205 (-) Transcript_20997:34-648(-)
MHDHRIVTTVIIISMIVFGVRYRTFDLVCTISQKVYLRIVKDLALLVVTQTAIIKLQSISGSNWNGGRDAIRSGTRASRSLPAATFSLRTICKAGILLFVCLLGSEIALELLRVLVMLSTHILRVLLSWVLTLGSPLAHGWLRCFRFVDFVAFVAVHDGVARDRVGHCLPDTPTFSTQLVKKTQLLHLINKIQIATSSHRISPN